MLWRAWIDPAYRLSPRESRLIETTRRPKVHLFNHRGRPEATIGTTGRYGIGDSVGNSTTSTLLGGFNLTFYTVDGTTFPFVEYDSGQVSTGVIVLQNPTASGSAAIAHSNHYVAQPLFRPHAALHQLQKK